MEKTAEWLSYCFLKQTPIITSHPYSSGRHVVKFMTTLAPTHFSISTYLICQRGLYPLFSVPLLTLPYSLTHCSPVSVPLTPQASVTRGLPFAKFNASLPVPTQHHFEEAFYTVHNSLLETRFSFCFHTSPSQCCFFLSAPWVGLSFCACPFTCDGPWGSAFNSGPE